MILESKMALTGKIGPPRRRGMASQKNRRLAERDIRKSALATLRWMCRRGETLQQAAQRLGLSPETLRSWQARWSTNQMQVAPRGRPAQHADRQLRLEILAAFALMGPHVGLPALQDLFPEVARGELLELQRRCRYAYRTQNRWLVHTLRWLLPGRVWAMDFSDPEASIDGSYPKLLAVRDLASGNSLLALPAETDRAEVARDALQALFARHGAPLVVKSDNGGAFVSSELTELLRRHGVLQLTSPPCTPRYNGSIEAGIGSLKTRAHYESARNDRLGHWTCDDVEAARLQTNLTARPFGPMSLTPDQAWQARSSVTQVERDRLQQVYDGFVSKQRAAREQQLQLPFGAQAEASIRRVALGQALIECGYLLVRRKRISPPFIRQRVAKIS